MPTQKGITCPHCRELNPNPQVYHVSTRGPDGKTIFVDQEIQRDKDHLYCDACGKDMAFPPRAEGDKELLPSPFEYFEPKTHRFLAKVLGDDIMQKYQFRTFKDNKEILFWTSKMWERNAEVIIHKEVQKRLHDHTKSHYVKEVTTYVKGETYFDRKDFMPPLHLINLQNGVYDQVTRELLPHNPDFMFTHMLPIVYDPAATCPEFDKFLDQVQPDPLLRDLLWEHVGELLHRVILFDRIVLLVGGGRNGKSTFVEAIIAFVGAENTARRSMQQLESNRFALADLYDKHLNAYPDQSPKPLTTTSVFKSAVAGDPLQGERKNKDPFNFEPYAKWFVSTNQVPRTEYDDTDAYYARFDILEFPSQFLEKPEDPKLIDPTKTYADPNILDKLTTPGELSGIFNKAMLALDRLLERGRFCAYKTTEQRRDQYTKLSDPVAAFVEEEIDITQEDSDRIERDLLYHHFSEYLKTHRYTPMSNKLFYKTLRDDYSVIQRRIRDGTQRWRVFTGLRFKQEENATTKDRPPGQPTLEGYKEG
jgi:putative DNA primase/helicase